MAGQTGNPFCTISGHPFTSGETFFRAGQLGVLTPELPPFLGMTSARWL
jgi:hypothetical protein